MSSQDQPLSILPTTQALNHVHKMKAGEGAGDRAGGRRERHLHVRDAFGRHVHGVDQPQLPDVDRDLGVEALLKRLVDDPLFERTGRRGNLLFAHSVEAMSSCPFKIVSSVCHASVAHLTRAGNWRTPEKTASLPRPAPSALTSGGPVRRSWNFPYSVSASARLLPFTESVMIDAEAFEIAQPEPWKATSAMRSPSIRT